jgi:hypothetical protein
MVFIVLYGIHRPNVRLDTIPRYPITTTLEHKQSKFAKALPANLSGDRFGTSSDNFMRLVDGKFAFHSLDSCRRFGGI